MLLKEILRFEYKIVIIKLINFQRKVLKFISRIFDEVDFVEGYCVIKIIW